MIIGVGTDLVDIQRIADALDKHGERFTQRCFSDVERKRAEEVVVENRAGFYAKRWAAKEAVAKALGKGFRDEVFLKDISVSNDDQGKPEVHVTGAVHEVLQSKTFKGMRAKIDISLSDDAGRALAFVVISMEKET